MKKNYRIFENSMEWEGILCFMLLSKLMDMLKVIDYSEFLKVFDDVLFANYLLTSFRK